MNNGNYILIADSHIREETAEKFFTMLEELGKYAPAGVIFLGDIFELWIALDGYESRIHRRFLSWCRTAKQHFEVGFILGNHEFYVKEQHADSFSWIEEVSHTSGNGVHFVHGDLINRADTGYLLLRKLLRNGLTRFLLKIFSRTIGPNISRFVLHSLKPTNQQHKRHLPVKWLKQYAQEASGERVRIFSGHFHRHWQFCPEEGAPVEILPAWDAAGEIICLSPDLQTRCAPWQELLLLPAVPKERQVSGRM